MNKFLKIYPLVQNTYQGSILNRILVGLLGASFPEKILYEISDLKKKSEVVDLS